MSGTEDIVYRLRKRAGKDCVKFDHPAYHKRLHGKAPYPLFAFLKASI